MLLRPFRNLIKAPRVRHVPGEGLGVQVEGLKPKLGLSSYETDEPHS